MKTIISKSPYNTAAPKNSNCDLIINKEGNSCISGSLQNYINLGGCNELNFNGSLFNPGADMYTCIHWWKIIGAYFI